MANLLECLLQIKGLRESADRVAALVHGADPGRWRQAGQDGSPSALDLLTRLAELELVHGASLRLWVTGGASVLPSVDETAFLDVARLHDWQPPEALAVFLTRRGENLDILDRCTAEDLGRPGTHPVRKHPIVADQVAIMLASDFVHLGEMRMVLKP